MVRLAAVEAGGTTWVCTICEDTPENIVERADFVTDSPEVTCGQIREWLKERKFDAIGIAAFGPIDMKEGSTQFGYMTSTPKLKWTNTDVLRILGIYDEFKHIPYKFDTDVNAPALAEYCLKKTGMKLTSSCYITVGTGVGVGLVCNGMTIKGLMHPESGHILVAKQPGDDYPGHCPYHGACLEGLACSAALAERAKCSIHDLATLPDDHPVWDTCAFYLAQLCTNIVLIASPEHISFGGGVLNRACLLPKIRVKFLELLNNYVQHEFLTPQGIDNYITLSHWGKNTGIVGAAYLALLAYDQKSI